MSPFLTASSSTARAVAFGQCSPSPGGQSKYRDTSQDCKAVLSQLIGAQAAELLGKAVTGPHMRHVAILAPLLAPDLVGGRYLQQRARLRTLAERGSAAGMQAAEVHTASGK